jgi:hypothetical protein
MGQGATTRADLKNGIPGKDAKLVHDFSDDVPIDEKILTKTFLGTALCCTGMIRHCKESSIHSKNY